MAVVTGERAGQANARQDLKIVDGDIHPFVSLRDVRERMTERAWRNSNIGSDSVPAREHNRFLHPTGPLRLDAVPPGGGLAGSDPSYAVIDYLDRYNISAGLICSTQSHAVVSWADDQAVNEYLAAINDLFIEQWCGLDNRYKHLICVSPHNPQAAIREVERLADVPGVVGVHMPTSEINLGNMILTPLYEACAHYGLPFCLHPNGSEGAIRNSPTHAGYMTRTFAERHANLAQSGQAQFVSLVLGGALERVPGLKVMFAEFGFSWVGPMMWRMDNIWKRRGGASVSLQRPPSHYVREQVRFTTQPYDEPQKPSQLALLLEAMHAEETLIFSSDYPHWDTDEPQLILTHRLPTRYRERVAYQTASETFGERLWK